MEVMHPRKGPAWANDAAVTESSLTSTAKQQLGAPGNVDIDVDDGPVREEGLSDLDWMRQRMSKNVDTVQRAFEQSDDEDTPNEPVRHLFPANRDPSQLTCLTTESPHTYTRGSSPKGPNERNNIANIPSVRSESGLFMHGCRSSRIVQSVW